MNVDELHARVVQSMLQPAALFFVLFSFCVLGNREQREALYGRARGVPIRPTLIK